MEMNSGEIYRNMFREYPDVLDVKQVSKVLDISKKTVYKLIGNGTLQSLKVGREFRIPKVILLDYLEVLKRSAS